MSKCQCGLLEKQAADPRIPIAYNAESDSYSLELSKDFTVPDIYCLHCGGHDLRNRHHDYPLCRCGKLDQWAKNPALPVRFYFKQNTYHLFLKEHNRVMAIYFCPACGGGTGLLKKIDQMPRPEEKDMKDIMQRLRGLTTIEQVIQILGEPDKRHGPMTSPQQEKQIYGIKDTKQSLIYKFPAKSLMLYVCQYEDDTLGFSFSGIIEKKLSFLKKIKYYRYRIKKYLQRFNIILWQYAPDTPAEKLLCHHKISRKIIYAASFCMISSMSLLASAFIFDSEIEGMIAALLGIIGVLLFIPALFCWVWASEIEKTLKQRQHPLPARLSLTHRQRR